MTQYLYTTKINNGGDLVTKEILKDCSGKVKLIVWTQNEWNNHRQKELNIGTLVFDMPTGGTSIIEYEEIYHVILAHNRLDRIDVYTAVQIRNALGGFAFDYELFRN